VLRRVAIVAVVIAGLVTTAATPRGAAAATGLYPDLKTLPPRDLRFDRTDVSANGAGVIHNVLRFSNTVWNAGQGELVLTATVSADAFNVSQACKSLPLPCGDANQLVYDTSGNSVSYPAGAIYYHAAHQHYHFDNWGRYELWTKPDYDAWIASGRTNGHARNLGTKTTSCVEDEEFIATLAATPWPGVYTGSGCLPNSQNVIREGLSPGWGDTYDYYRFEQWIDLGATGSLGDGTYVLRSVVDPLNKIYESPGKSDVSHESEQDNEAITPFTVSGGQILDGSPPSGTVAINHVDQVASTPNVIVSVLGRDDVGPVDQIRISNDGQTWRTLPYSGSGSRPQDVPWDLTDTTYGGTGGTGVKTVYAQVHDASGRWSSTFTDAITLDATSSNYQVAVLSDSPSGYWRLGEPPGTGTAGDRAGPNSGTYLNGPTLGVPGLIATDPGTAASFDGVGSYVSIPSSTGLAPASAVSVEAWIKPASIPSTGFASVVTKRESYSLQFNAARLEFTIMQNGVRYRTQAPVGAVVAGTAYHVVGTYDGTTQKLYLNGSIVATTNRPGAVSVNSNALTIASWGGTKEFFRGVVDDAAVYPLALTAARIQAHYATAIGPAQVQQYTLGASVTGTGSGTLRSQPVGVDCPTACSARFDAGTLVVVTAYPSNTSTFSGWSGACTGTGSCQVTMSADRSVTAMFVPSTYASAVEADQPIGFWRLSESSGSKASDSASSPHDGTYRNGVTIGVAGLIPTDAANHAARLDGVDDYIQLPNHPGKNPPAAVSLEAWLKPSAIPTAGSFASIVTKPGAWSLQLNGPRLEFTVIQAGVYHRLLAPSGAIVAGGAYHVVGVFDGARQLLYVNGALVASRTQSGQLTQNNTNVYLGSWNGSKEFLNGVIDEVAIYGFALSAGRISAHYDTAKGP